MQRLSWPSLALLVGFSSLPFLVPSRAASSEAAILLFALRHNAYLDSTTLPLCVAELPPTERSTTIQVLPDYEELRDVPDDVMAALRLERPGIVNWSDCEPDPNTSLLDSWLYTGSRLRDQ